MTATTNSTAAGTPAAGTTTVDASRPALRATPRAGVVLMSGYHSPQLEVKVRLNTNEAPEPPPTAWREEVRTAAASISFNRYPDREAHELRRRIGALHGVGVEQVHVANGSNEVLQSLLLAYGGHGRCVAVFEPTYALHSHIARLTGTAVVEGERDGDFLVPESGIGAVLEKARADHGPENPVITFLCSPNNPTGRLEPRHTVERVLGEAPGLVVVDEAYGQFAPWSAVELLRANPHLVVVRTFSKTWSLAGLRLGYAIGDPEVIDAMWRVTLPYHLDALKQAAGCAALDHDDDMRARVARLAAERGRLVERLRNLGAEVVPSDANFVLFRPPVPDSKAVWQGLVERSVL
ncbi:MAG TPA: aminotransferase class I/II-fold pyridoxal phosphate-dependent enzyme, partial [Acidimicrobiales bacterium]|nr:aminotransferase class I/II-fold pyridoxal phosphate-dependent enzyme [Acidimicrobiales bacterium]